MAEKGDPKSDDKDQASKASLVPLYSPLDVTRGIQAYRRGDIILYTVRGKPSKVQELIGELSRRGVNELVALVSHRAGAEPSQESSDEPTDRDGAEAEQQQ